MTDSDIIDFFIDKKRFKIYEARVNRRNMEKNTPEMKKYLDTRFSDGFESYSEVIARIYHGIEKRPICRVCGKPLKFKSLREPYGKWCSNKCQLRDTDFIKWRSSAVNYEESVRKVKKTKKEKYGNENYNNRKQAEKTNQEKFGCVSPLCGNSEVRKKIEKENLEKFGKKTITNVAKIKNTKRERYGDENFVNREQAKKTMQKRYGSEFTLSSSVLMEKVKKTKKEKYGNENYVNAKKIVETMQERYGVSCSFQIPEVRSKIDHEKIIETKRKKHNLNSSKQEDRLFLILIEMFSVEDVIRNYRDERYRNPKNNRRYLCDFYVISLDLFVELQGHYTHGKHPFDENNEEDVELKKKYEGKISENKPSYKKIIDVWTEADVIKREVATKNGLNYLEIFGTEFTNETVEQNIKHLFKKK